MTIQTTCWYVAGGVVAAPHGPDGRGDVVVVGAGVELVVLLVVVVVEVLETVDATVVVVFELLVVVVVELLVGDASVSTTSCGAVIPVSRLAYASADEPLASNARLTVPWPCTAAVTSTLVQAWRMTAPEVATTAPNAGAVA